MRPVAMVVAIQPAMIRRAAEDTTQANAPGWRATRRKEGRGWPPRIPLFGEVGPVRLVGPVGRMQEHPTC
jgi:hypothetical protein